MAWLGVVFALLVGYEFAVELSRETTPALEIAGWVICVVFLAEFGVRPWLAPSRVRFLRRHRLQFVMAVPALRAFRFLRLLRLGRALPASRVVSASYRSAGAARQLFRARLAYTGGLAAIAVVALAELVSVFERGQPGDGFGRFGDALIWSAGTVMALQADPVPPTTAGRLAMLAGLAFGVVVASVAGTVGACPVQDRRERVLADEAGGDDACP